MYNVSVIGCGARGRKHADVWADRDDARVVAVCDPDQSRCASLAEQVGAVAYRDWREAVLHDGVDVVSVCAPTNLHADVSCLAAENDRHIFCEKPFALTMEDGQRLLSCLRHHEVVFMPCFQRRDQGVYPKCREFFQAGAFGGPIMFRYTLFMEVRPKTAMHSRSVNGGVVIDMACHIFDLMRWISGSEPQRIYATGRVFGKGKPRLRHIADLAIDEASIELTMRGGHQLQLYLNWGMPEGFPNLANDEWVVGPELAIQQQGNQMQVRYADHTETWPIDVSAGHSRRIDRFVRVLNGEQEQDLTAEDAYIALKLSHMALESIETGKAIEWDG